MITECYCETQDPLIICNFVQFDITAVTANLVLETPTVRATAGITIATDSSYREVVTITEMLSSGDSKSFDLDITVCGNEAIAAIVPTPLINLFLIPNATPFTWLWTNLAPYFAITHGTTTNVACSITRYGVYADAAMTTLLSDPMVIQQVNGVDLDISSSYPAKSIWIAAITRGQVKAAKELTIEVCGNEVITVSGGSLDYLGLIPGSGVMSFPITDYSSKFSINSILCPQITAYSVLDSAGVAYTGPDLAIGALGILNVGTATSQVK